MRQRRLEVDDRAGCAEVGGSPPCGSAPSARACGCRSRPCSRSRSAIRLAGGVVQDDRRHDAAERVGELFQLAVARSSVQMLKMLPFFAVSGSSGTVGIGRGRREDQRVVVEELCRRLVVGAEGQLRLLLRVEIETEQLLVAADARRVDEELAVRRVDRAVIEEIVGRQVDDLRRSRDRPCRCRGCRRASPRTPPCVPSSEKFGDSGSSTDFIGTRVSILRVSTFWTISVRSFSVRTK